MEDVIILAVATGNTPLTTDVTVWYNEVDNTMEA